MTPDYRALCAELVELSAPVDSISQLAERLQKLNELAARARALLAEPEPEGPTDEELPEDFIGFEKGFAQEHLARLMRDAIGTETNHNAYIVAAGRILDRPEFAHVARWGSPTPVPVAIPGEKYHEDMGPVTWWRLPVDEPPWVGTPNDSDWPGYHTHFTPAPTNPLNAHALPTPEAKP